MTQRSSSVSRGVSGGALGTAVVLVALGGLALWLLRLQGAWPAWKSPGALRWTSAAFVIVAYLGLCAAIWNGRRYRNAAAEPSAGSDAGNAVLVVHASQTGFAEQLAAQTAESLRAAGVAVRIESLGRLDLAALEQASQALFLVSTTGEGDAPDNAAGFVGSAFAATPDLTRLRYGVLALGDSEYTNFCAFGHRLDAWLRRAGAQPLFDAVEVDNGDEGALRHWQHQLGVMSGSPDLPDWQLPRYARWRLRERRLLNPGSAGGACFEVVLEPLDASVDWQAGDIAEVGVRNGPESVSALLAQAGLRGDEVVRSASGEERLDALLARSRLPALGEAIAHSVEALAAELRPLAHREYSIASLPAEGAIRLLVRQWRRADGSLGLGAGWLTEYAERGAEIALRIRANANFHVPPDARPLILIGNGTGVAGLRGLLAQRVADGHRRNWLVFGERNAAHDFHYREDIEAWQRAGWIERLDLAFSRDQSERIYVQHRLADAADALRAWVADGAAIYVCGSLAGMAPGVDEALAAAIGREALSELAASDRYRRDVY